MMRETLTWLAIWTVILIISVLAFAWGTNSEVMKVIKFFVGFLSIWGMVFGIVCIVATVVSVLKGDI